MTLDRYARHRQLPEIGDAGQSALERASVTVSVDAPGAEVERLYLERAGLGIRQGPALGPFPHGVFFRHAAAAACAAGSWRALAHMRAVLSGLGEK